MTYFVRCFLIIVLSSGIHIFAFSASSQNGKCKWNTQLTQALIKYENYSNGLYEADDADILLPLGYKKMCCVLDSVIKKEKYDYNLDALLWLTFIPDSLFSLSPASIKYLVNNKNAHKKNAGRMLLNEKQKKRYSIDKDIIEDRNARDFIEYLIYEYKSDDNQK